MVDHGCCRWSDLDTYRLLIFSLPHTLCVVKPGVFARKAVLVANRIIWLLSKLCIYLPSQYISTYDRRIHIRSILVPARVCTYIQWK